MDFQPEVIKKDKEEHFLLTNRDTGQEKLLILNIYVPNTKAPTFIKEILIKLKMYISPNTIIVGDFNTALSPMDRSWKKKLNKDTAKLAETLNQLELIDIYRSYDPKVKEYTFISPPHGTFLKIDHIIGHRTSLLRYKKI